MEKVGVGVWSFGMGSDRYVDRGYKPYINFDERVEKISGIAGIKGIEVTFPQDINWDNYKEKLLMLRDKDLKLSCMGVELVCDKEWEHGSFSSADSGRRRISVELTKKAMDLAEILDIKVINLWLGQDGFDYVFQTDYSAAWRNIVEGLVECADHNPKIKLGIEYKLSEPKMNCIVNSGGKALALALLTGRQNVGVTLDVGHAFNAGENPGEIASILMETNKLFHLHLNDNYRIADDDMPMGTVHWPQYIELFYWLKKLGYDGWYTLDLYPYRDDPSTACETSINFMEKVLGLAEKIIDEKDFSHGIDAKPGEIVNKLINRVFG